MALSSSKINLPNTYLVGGAVRDRLLGITIKERDFVVVGQTPEKMLSLGFSRVGRDFPVFLHPKTHEEYALARTERKTGKGYTNFTCRADSTVTLEDDLQRRDLTINAMAQTSDGQLIDPYGGLQDIKRKILRHVSPAFAEDPVRVLRVARFAAKFGDFTVHPDTINLMHDMLDAGEIDALVKERVWKELVKALQESHPERFFETLQRSAILPRLFAELSSKLPSCLRSLKQAAQLTDSPEIRFAALVGGLDPEEIKAICQRYLAPKSYLQLGSLVAKHLHAFLAIPFLSAEEIVTVLEKVDALRQTKRFEQFLLACSATAVNYENDQNTLRSWQAAYCAAKDATKNNKITSLVEAGIKGEELKEKIHVLRTAAIQVLMKKK